MTVLRGFRGGLNWIKESPKLRVNEGKAHASALLSIAASSVKNWNLILDGYTVLCPKRKKRRKSLNIYAFAHAQHPLKRWAQELSESSWSRWPALVVPIWQQSYWGVSCINTTTIFSSLFRFILVVSGLLHLICPMIWENQLTFGVSPLWQVMIKLWDETYSCPKETRILFDLVCNRVWV